MCSFLSSLGFHWTGPLITFTKEDEDEQVQRSGATDPAATKECILMQSHLRRCNQFRYGKCSSSMRVCASADEAIEIYFYSSMRWKCLLNWQLIALRFHLARQQRENSHFAHLNDDAWRHRSSTKRFYRDHFADIRLSRNFSISSLMGCCVEHSILFLCHEIRVFYDQKENWRGKNAWNELRQLTYSSKYNKRQVPHCCLSSHHYETS